MKDVGAFFVELLAEICPSDTVSVAEQLILAEQQIYCKYKTQHKVGNCGGKPSYYAHCGAEYACKSRCEKLRAFFGYSCPIEFKGAYLLLYLGVLAKLSENEVTGAGERRRYLGIENSESRGYLGNDYIHDEYYHRYGNGK